MFVFVVTEEKVPVICFEKEKEKSIEYNKTLDNGDKLYSARFLMHTKPKTHKWYLDLTTECEDLLVTHKASLPSDHPEKALLFNETHDDVLESNCIDVYNVPRSLLQSTMSKAEISQYKKILVSIPDAYRLENKEQEDEIDLQEAIIKAEGFYLK